MSLSTVDGFAGAFASNGQDLQVHKLVPTVGVANTPHSLWAGGGIPAAGTYGSTGKANCRLLTSASTGAYPYANAASGTQYLLRAGMNPLATTAQGTIYLVDRISDCAIAHAEATGSFSGGPGKIDATSRLPAASANAEACQIWVYVTGALSAASNTINFTYTNQAGTGSRTSANMVTVASAVANRSVNANLFVGLAAGDTGVRSIESMTLVSGSATGTIVVCLVRILARIPIPVADGHVERDMVGETPAVKSLYDDTCFDWILTPSGAAAASTPMIGNIALAYGLAMAISTIATASDAVRRNGQNLGINKAVPSVGVANVPHSLWAGAGFPSIAGTYGATGKANGRVLTGTSAGGVRYQNALASSQMYLMGAGMSPGASTCTGTAYLVDRIADCAIAHAEATGSFTGLTATSRLPAAATNAEGCQIWVYVTSALSAASNVFTLTYTNQAGTGSKTTPNITTVASAVANRSVNLNMFVELAAGDTGVRSIDSITAVSGAGTGTICVALVRVLARINIPLINTVIERNYYADMPGWKSLYDDTCFDWILTPSGAAANGTLMTGNILVASGLPMLIQGKLFGRAVNGQVVSTQKADVVLRTAPLGRTEPQSPQISLPISLAWDPRDTGQVAFWVRGDFGVGLKYWNDASGRNLCAYQDFGTGYEPVVDDTAVNGKPGARFDGTTYYKLPTLPIGDSAGLGYVYTTVIVYQLDSTLAASSYSILMYALDDEGYSNAFLLAGSSTGYEPFAMKSRYAATDVAVGFGSAAMYDANGHAVITTYDGVDSTAASSYTGANNGVAQTVIGDGAFVNLALGSIGGDASAATGLVGVIAEIIVFQGALSAGERNSLDEYLSRRYGVYAMTGTGSVALSPLVDSATGTHSTGSVTGTGSTALSPLVLASTGTETMTGTGTAALSPLVLASTGTETITGAGTCTLSPLVLASTGTETFTGSGSVALSPLVIDSTGTETFTGSASCALSPIVLASTGTETFTGTGTAALSPLVLSSTGTETLTGTGTADLSPLVLSSTGTEVFTGSATCALSPLVCSSSGTESMDGTGSAALSPLVLSSTGTESFTGTGTAALSPLVLDSSGLQTINVTGTCATDLSPLVVSSTGTETISGSASCALSPLVLTSSGTEIMTGTATCALSPLVLDAAGSHTINIFGTCSSALSPLVLASSGDETLTGSGSAALSPFVLSSSGSETIEGTALCALSPLACAATGTHIIPPVTGTGSCALSPLVLAADGYTLTNVSGSCAVDLSPLVAASTGSHTINIFGTASVDLQPFALVASGGLSILGTAQAAISSLVASGDGSLGILGQVVASLASLGLTSTGLRVLPDATTPMVVFFDSVPVVLPVIARFAFSEGGNALPRFYKLSFDAAKLPSVTNFKKG